MDTLYAASDSSHKARGWEVRKGLFGARRYRLDVAGWLESQRRIERYGSTPGRLSSAEDDRLLESMLWTQADMTPVLREAVDQARSAGVPFEVWSAPRCTRYGDRREAA